MMLFSVGFCSLCYDSSDALIVKNPNSGTLFFFCPNCGLAWHEPPKLQKVDSLNGIEKFAPEGITLPSRAEIVAAGFAELIVAEYENNEHPAIKDYLIQLNKHQDR